MADIKLRGAHSHRVAVVDDDDYTRIAHMKWYYHDGYAATNYVNRTLYMHRLVAHTPVGQHTDHINGDKLDNRKENLKVCTHAENMQNRSGIRKLSRGCIKKQTTKGKQYWYGELRALGQRFITTTFENEEQAKGGLKQMIKDREL